MRLGVRVLLFVVLWPALALAKTTIAVAPFVSPTEASAHIAEGLAHSLSGRVYALSELNIVTVRQVAAAARSLGVKESSYADPKVLARVGKQLGADIIVGGTLRDKKGNLVLELVRVNPQTGGAPTKENVTGNKKDLLQLDRASAQVFGKWIEAPNAEAFVAASPTADAQAWEALFLGLYRMRAQSLSPKSADPTMPPSLTADQLQSAQAAFNEALSKDKNLLPAHASLAVIYALQGDMTGATESLAKAQGGLGPMPTLATAFVAMRRGDADAAILALSGAVKATPGFLHARGTLGQLYNHLGRFREARATFQDYAEVAPHQPWALAQLGYTQSKLRKYDDAIATTEKATALVPDSPELLLELASRYIDAKRFDDAVKPLESAKKLAPKEGRILVRLGFVQLMRGQDALSIKASEAALKLVSAETDKKERSYAHMNLARAWGHMGQYDVTLEQLGHVKKLGVLDCSEIENDAKLAKFRNDPRYAKVKF